MQILQMRQFFIYWCNFKKFHQNSDSSTCFLVITRHFFDEYAAKLRNRHITPPDFEFVLKSPKIIFSGNCLDREQNECRFSLTGSYDEACWNYVQKQSGSSELMRMPYRCSVPAVLSEIHIFFHDCERAFCLNGTAAPKLCAINQGDSSARRNRPSQKFRWSENQLMLQIRRLPRIWDSLLLLLIIGSWFVCGSPAVS